MFVDAPPVDDRVSTPPAGRAAAGLSAAIDEVLAVDPATLADHELAEAMVSLRRVQARLTAAVVELSAAFDRRRVWADDGSRSAADWLATRSRRPRPQVAGEVRLGRRLATMPHTRAALRHGDIGDAHARLLSRLAANPRTASAFPDGEATLVAHARTMRFDDFERVCAHWRDAADPDGPEQRRARDDALRRVSLAPGLDGVGHLDGYLTPVGHATVGGALERLEDELFRADWAEARARHGDDVTADRLARTAAQRRHDALVEMATRAMTAPPDGRRPRPLVTVMVGYETFAGRVCEFATGTVLAPGTVAGLLGTDDTLIERVVFDGPNRITDISTARSFRGTLRRVLEVKQRRCGHPSCHVPAHRCQGDHITAWSQGGLTTQDNGQLLCGPHNRHRYTNPRGASAPTPDSTPDPGPDPVPDAAPGHARTPSTEPARGTPADDSGHIATASDVSAPTRPRAPALHISIPGANDAFRRRATHRGPAPCPALDHVSPDRWRPVSQ